MERVLRLMAEKDASDVFLSANTPILIKIGGEILQLSDQPLTHAQPRQLIAELLTPLQLEELDDTGELNVGLMVSGVGSFRLSAFKQRGTVAAVIRCIPFRIPTLEELRVPALLGTLVTEKRGLILVVGATGSGKSTHARRDDRAPQPADGRPHPDHRGPDRVPVRQQALGRQPARGRARHAVAAGRPAQRAAGRRPTAS